MDWVRFLSIAGILSVLVGIALLFTFYPQQLIRLQARLLYRIYKGYFRLSDEQIDKMRPAPGTKELISSSSQYLNEGSISPHNFPKFEQYIRTLGLILWSMLLFAVVLILWAIATGKKMYWP